MGKNSSIFSIDTQTQLFEEEPGVIIPNFADDESQIKYHWFNAFETANQTAYPFEMSDGRQSLLIQPKKLIEQLQQELLLQKQMKNFNQKD